MVRFTALLCALFFFASSGPAQAKWLEASTDHFVIYADDQEKDLREFASKLERYHAAMELVSGRKTGKPSPSNRLVIFVVSNQREIRKLAGGNSRYVQGFYIPRAGSSRAFVQDIQSSRWKLSSSMHTLLHEYAHHFLMTTTPYALPRWFSEGAAEFYSAASFEEDGGVSIGKAAVHRAGELFYAREVSAEELLDPELYADRKRRGYDAFYGRSWLLYHYLSVSEERSGQLREYVNQMIAGKTSIEAARAVFGDLDVLDDELDDYRKQRDWNYFPIPASMVPVGSIAIRELPKGEARMMDVRMQSQRGVNREQAIELVEDARKIAARYPDDAGVLTALAEAEYDAGNDEAAIAAADRAIALDPSRTNAYVQKGYALFRKAEDADDPETAYSEAMAPFTALNAIENDHPLPLIYFYRSYAERGAEPPENARHALERAAQLAPFDHSLAMNAGIMLAGEGKIALARAILGPVASNPHGGSLAEEAARIRAQLAGIDEGVHWIPSPSESDEESEEGDNDN